MEPPIIIRLLGGLGNQLFQLVFADRVRESTGRRVLVDLSWFDHQAARHRRDLSIDPAQFGFRTIRIPRRLPEVLDRFGRGVHIVERTACDDVFPAIRRSSLLITGYFQRYESAERSRRLLARVVDRYIPGATSPMPYVAVHVRLGDYRQSAEIRRVHAVTDPAWSFARARSLAGRLGIDEVRLFSDEPEEVLRLVGSEVAGGVEVDESRRPWEVIAAVRSASGIVMSNSSLSWWAAFIATELDQSGIPVVMPTPWMATTSCFDQRLPAPGWSVEERWILR